MELEKIPERIRTRIGDDSIQEKIDDFFINTKNYIESKQGLSPHFEKRLENFENSDSHMHSLLYKDKCVAGVFERRTDYNNLEYVFFRALDF